MYLTILILPLLASIITGFFGRKVGVTGSQFISCGCVVLTTLIAILTFVEVGVSNIPLHVQLFR
jgi:NADH-ubiquinone oxidoreductase chain 5